MANVYSPDRRGGFLRSSSPLDPKFCKAGVYTRFSSNAHSYAQCARKAGADGWCKQHHPDTEAERARASQAKWEAGNRKHAMGWYGETFMAALIKIRDGDNDPRETARLALDGCDYATTPTKESDRATD